MPAGTVQQGKQGGPAMGGGGGLKQSILLICVVLLAEGAIFQGALFSRDLFLMHKCLNRDHHSCDKPLKANPVLFSYNLTTPQFSGSRKLVGLK